MVNQRGNAISHPASKKRMRRIRKGKKKKETSFFGYFVFFIALFVILFVAYLLLDKLSYKSQFLCEYMGRFWVQEPLEGGGPSGIYRCVRYPEYYTKYY